MIYELREYIAYEQKIDALHRRFQSDVLQLFKKHNIRVKGFWTDLKNPAKLIYLCQFDSEKEQKNAWAAFANDPEWRKVKQISEAEGPLTLSMNSVLLEPVDYVQQ